MKKLLILILAILAFGCKQQPDAELAVESTQEEIPKRKLAKFEPKDGEVLLFVGQELEAVGGLEAFNDGYLDHFDRPAGWTTYSNINPGENSFGRTQEGLDGLFDTHDWGDNDYNATLQLNSPNYENMALAIGLQFVNHEEKVADGSHDAYINKLADFLLSLGKRPVFLRVAYEFDGDPWNHYDRKTTIKAYKRIVDMLRAKGVENTAYVWQSTGFISGQEHLEGWYPGDDYVDWCGVSFFNRWKEIEMFEFARKKGKPVFIAEATPTISDYGGKLYGLTKETQLSDSIQAEEAWEKWFIPFFSAIDDNPDVVKAMHYINCHWDSHPMWVNNPTFKGIDARLHLSDSISERWRKITSQSKYIKSTPDLYEKLYNNN
ncbi:endo-1,3-beta-xylanase [Flagellimonas hymeniacidonis]|uniref:Endo-1,3-beta-xylanase n=1 Tax=Flagellimonas hymeniacidonis TaxID=2603628 RepID=A0A5C8V990_9FLAO|nr:glycosyl hydrolase [Flagellimonas hymeniacidonis]TXN38272.1 endo-1,3-beta-xylanase [Flagellimonas hymeniacidonis]